MLGSLNIGILRMTGEVADRFNGITLFNFGRRLYKMCNSFSHRQNRMGISRLTCFADFFQTTTLQIGCQGLLMVV